MARRKYYGRKRISSSRRLILTVALLAVGVGVVWRVFFAVPGSRGVVEDKIIRIPPGSREVVDEPKITLPVNSKPAIPAPAIQGSVKSSNPEPTQDASNSQAEMLFQQGCDARAKSDNIGAREKLTKAVELGLSSAREGQARDLLNKAADDWLFSQNIFEKDKLCRRYKVVSGDLLTQIGKSYGVPYKFLMRINNIEKAESLAAGETIKVVQGPFNAVVQRNRFLMSVYLGDILVRTYRVGLGTAGRQTPTGLWRVKLKQPDPKWTDPETGKVYLPNDPDNPLGNYWIALEGLEGDALGRTGFGIHGTIKPDEIGQATSRGCIRLYNHEIEELYDMLIEQKSQVRVVE